ncbi:hypothetical protein IKQ26_08925 [bacterium]|nr:hypothetical protein [bacterium]
MIKNSVISEEIINIRYSDIDFDKSLKMFSLLNFFQDIASDNAEKFGFGYSYIHPKNLMWVLLKYRIEFDEYPSDVQQVKLITEPRGCNRLFAYRNFELRCADKRLARASSTWALVDYNTMEIANCDKVFETNELMTKFEPVEGDLKYNKIPPMTSTDHREEFKVRYNDIDVNMHANNANYIVWALEPLPLEFKTAHKLKNVDMVYKKEIKYGAELISEVQITEDNKTLHRLKNKATNDDLCLVQCEWI